MAESNIYRLPLVAKSESTVREGATGNAVCPCEWPGLGLDLDVEIEGLAQLMAERTLRVRRQRVERNAWIDSSPTVVRFPASQKTLARGEPDCPDRMEISELDTELEGVAKRAAERCDEILIGLGELPR